MKKCLTKQSLSTQYSGCLVEKPECGHAQKFGFSFICCHPDHTKFQAHVASELTINGARDLYDALRLKRRNEFTINLDEDSRRFFSLQAEY